MNRYFVTSNELGLVSILEVVADEGLGVIQNPDTQEVTHIVERDLIDMDGAIAEVAASTVLRFYYINDTLRVMDEFDFLSSVPTV